MTRHRPPSRIGWCSTCGFWGALEPDRKCSQCGGPQTALDVVPRGGARVVRAARIYAGAFDYALFRVASPIWQTVARSLDTLAAEARLFAHARASELKTPRSRR